MVNYVVFLRYKIWVGDKMRTKQNIYRRRDGRWEGRYFKEYDSNGKIKYSSVYAKTYTEVKEKLNSIKTNTLKKSTNSIKTDFKDACKEWLEYKKSSIKISSYAKYNFIVEKYILPFFNNCKLYELNKNSLNELIIKNNNLAPSTQKNIATVFKAIISFVNDKYNLNLEITSCQFKKAYAENMKVLSVFEQEKLVRYLLNNIDLINLGILVCLFTGLRIGEICALKWSDIDLKNKTIKVSKTIQRVQIVDDYHNSKTTIISQSPKSNNSIREIPMTDDLISIIYKNVKNFNKNTYFLTGNKHYIEPRNLQNKFKKILANAKINDINFHALRHTFATRAIENGIDVKSVSEILGHSNVSMTLQKYVHISMQQKLKEINKLKLF